MADKSLLAYQCLGSLRRRLLDLSQPVSEADRLTLVHLLEQLEGLLVRVEPLLTDRASPPG